jgi:tetratricopeptide (TPR) repeat protein
MRSSSSSLISLISTTPPEAAHIIRLRQLARDAFQLAEKYFESKAYADAIHHYKSALHHLQRIEERVLTLEDYRQFESCHSNIAVAFGFLQDWDSVLEHLDYAFKFVDKIQEIAGIRIDNLISKAHYLYTAGICSRQLKEEVPANLCFEQALLVCEEINGLKKQAADSMDDSADDNADDSASSEEADYQQLLSNVYVENGKTQEPEMEEAPKKHAFNHSSKLFHIKTKTSEHTESVAIEEHRHPACSKTQS